MSLRNTLIVVGNVGWGFLAEQQARYSLQERARDYLREAIDAYQDVETPIEPITVVRTRKGHIIGADPKTWGQQRKRSSKKYNR